MNKNEVDVLSTNPNIVVLHKNGNKFLMYTMYFTNLVLVDITSNNYKLLMNRKCDDVNKAFDQMLINLLYTKAADKKYDCCIDLKHVTDTLSDELNGTPDSILKTAKIIMGDYNKKTTNKTSGNKTSVPKHNYIARGEMYVLQDCPSIKVSEKSNSFNIDGHEVPCRIMRDLLRTYDPDKGFYRIDDINGIAYAIDDTYFTILQNDSPIYRCRSNNIINRNKALAKDNYLAANFCGRYGTYSATIQLVRDMTIKISNIIGSYDTFDLVNMTGEIATIKLSDEILPTGKFYLKSNHIEYCSRVVLQFDRDYNKLRILIVENGTYIDGFSLDVSNEVMRCRTSTTKF
jgi:hypothetical protein